MRKILLLISVLTAYSLTAQTHFYGMTSGGGSHNQGTIFKTGSSGSNLQTVFEFKYHNPGRNPNSVFTQASNGKIYGTTQFGGSKLCSFPYYQYQKYSGVIFEYNPSTATYTVLFNFDDTTTGCWPTSAPVLASNGKLYGVTPGIGGFSQHYGTVYCYDLATSTYTKIHSFGQSSDGKNPVGNLLLAADGKLYGVTQSGGFQDKGIIFKIDPSTNTYTKLKDLWTSWSAPKAAQGAKAGLIQAPNGKMYGTSEEGGNYPSGYQYAYGNIFEYNPTTNTATNLYGFNNSTLGKNPQGAPLLVGSNDLYCVTSQYYQIPGTYNVEPHYYLWKYSISSATATVVDSIANGKFNYELAARSTGKILITGYDYNSSSAVRFWEFNPSTNTRTLIDTSTEIGSTKGIMLASNGKYYGGFRPYNSDGVFVEYDIANHTINKKFNFSDPTDGLQPQSGLLMASNGKLYGMTSKGGTQNKGVVFEFNPANDTYTKKFDLDSLTGYEPNGGLMEASNGKLYGMTTRGGLNSYGGIFEIDTTNWTLTKKADFNSTIRGATGRLTEAWDGNLYGLSLWNYGTIFQYNISSAALSLKHSFTSSEGTAPEGSLELADNGKLYGLTQSNGGSYYAHGTLFEYDPANNSFVKKKDMLNYTGYHAKGNTPLMASNGKMYLLLTTGGSGNTEYVGGAIDEYIPGSTTVSNKASFQVNNSGSRPLGDLMEAANGKFYGYTSEGGANNKGTLFEFNKTTSTLSKKVDFNGTNGAIPMRGSLTEVGLSNISISQQPTITSTCQGDTAYIIIAASHTTLLHYQWYKNGTKIAGATNDTLIINSLAASDNGTYSCKISGGARAVISNNLLVSTSPKPTVNIGALASSYCLNNADINLTATPTGGNFSGTGVSGTVFSPSNAGTGNVNIIYSYTNASGCSNSDTASVTINSLPNATFSGYSSTYCDNSTPSTLTPTTAGGTFTGSGINGNIFDPSFYAGGGGLMLSSKIKYEITDANSCYNADSVTITIYHAPQITLSGLDSIYCENAALDTLITSPSGGSVTAGSFLNGNIFTPANATIGFNYIYYSYTNSNNCTNSDTIKIKVNASPDASFSGLASTYCNNDDADTLAVTTSGGSFSGNITGMVFDPKQIVIPPNVISVPKSITYTVTNADGCTESATNTTTIFPLPVVNFGPLASNICHNGIPILLNGGAPSGGTFSGNGVQGIGFTPANAPLGNDTLTYSYTNSNSCTNIDTAIIEIMPAPEFTLGKDSTICINHIITLATKLGSGYVYLWSDGSTDSTLTIDASTLGTGTYTYSVTVTDQGNNCVETDDINITVDACTGMNNLENDNLDLSVYPNPSHGIFNISSETNFESIEIYAADGRLISTKNIKSKAKNFQIDLSNESSGIYYLLLIREKSIERKRLILK